MVALDRRRLDANSGDLFQSYVFEFCVQFTVYMKCVGDYLNGLSWFPLNLIDLDPDKLSQASQKADRQTEEKHWSGEKRQNRESHEIMPSQSVYSSS